MSIRREKRSEMIEERYDSMTKGIYSGLKATRGTTEDSKEMFHPYTTPLEESNLDSMICWRKGEEEAEQQGSKLAALVDNMSEPNLPHLLVVEELSMELRGRGRL